MNFFEDLQNQLGSYYSNVITILPKIGMAIVICLILSLIISTIRRKLVKYLRIKADDKLLANFSDSILHIINVILILLTFLYVVGLGGIATSILGAAGVSAFVIGFALKDIGENFLAGVVMAFDRPFRLGDTIKTGEVEGIITQMSLRDTHVKTFDGKDVFVPNGQIIKNPLYNYTIDGYLRQNFTVGVDYDTDVEPTRELILQVLSGIPGVLQEDKPPRTHVKNLNTSTIDIEVHFWINTFDKNYSGLELKSIAQSKVIQKLTEENVGLPAQVIELKNYDSELNVNNKSTQNA